MAPGISAWEFPARTRKGRQNATGRGAKHSQRLQAMARICNTERGVLVCKADIGKSLSCAQCPVDKSKSTPRANTSW